jgi:hypothetical protein
MLPKTKTLKLWAAAIGGLLIVAFFLAITPPATLFGALSALSMLALGAVTANQLIKRQAGCKQAKPLAASTTIYQGTLTFENTSGYLVGIVAAGANTFAGVAIDNVDNSAGSAGDLSAEVWQEGDFELSGSGFTQGDVGAIAYATDNYTVTTNSSAATRIGKIVRFVSTTRVVVNIDIQGDSIGAT